MSRALPIVFALLALAGCRAPVPAPEGDVDRREIYQRIADALPEGHFGWGTPPGLVEMAASTREEKPPELQPLICNERGFRVRLHAYRARTVWIPYDAIEHVTDEWSTFPNVFFLPLALVPFQSRRLTVVFDGAKVLGLLASLERDVERLEAVSRETGLGGPWSFAQGVKAELDYTESLYGSGRVAVHFDFLLPIFPWLPWRGRDWRVGQAFAWVQANPDAPVLEPAEAEAPQGAEGG